MAFHDEDDKEGQKVCNQETNDRPASVVEPLVEVFRKDAEV
jgi:hypothetical protein